MILPHGHARSDTPELRAVGTTTPGQGRCARREGPAAEWSPPDERAPRLLFAFVHDRCQVEFTHSTRSGLPLASCVSGRACALLWCPVPRRFNSLDVLIVSIPHQSAVIPKKSQQAMTNRHNKDHANCGVHANLLHFPVISFSPSGRIPDGAVQCEFSMPAKRGSWRRSGEHGNLANSARRRNGPLESNGIRMWRIPLRVPSADREATTSSFQKSSDGDASTFASYFGIFLMEPHVLPEEWSREPTPF